MTASLSASGGLTGCFAAGLEEEAVRERSRISVCSSTCLCLSHSRWPILNRWATIFSARASTSWSGYAAAAAELPRLTCLCPARPQGHWPESFPRPSMEPKNL